MPPLFTKIKGTLMVGIVRLFKSTKDERLGTYLTEKDRELLKEVILPATWYPADTARNLIVALFEVVGGNDPNAPRQWGRFAAGMLAPGTYKDFLRKGDPFETLKNFAAIFGSFVDSPWFKVFEVKPGYIEAVYRDPEDDPMFVPFAYMMAGWIEGLIGESGGKILEFTITREQREGGNAIVYRGRFA